MGGKNTGRIFVVVLHCNRYSPLPRLSSARTAATAKWVDSGCLCWKREEESSRWGDRQRPSVSLLPLSSPPPPLRSPLARVKPRISRKWRRGREKKCASFWGQKFSPLRCTVVCGGRHFGGKSTKGQPTNLPIKSAVVLEDLLLQKAIMTKNRSSFKSSL